MPKLTINSVCTRGSVYPMICNFQNGYPSGDFECKCAIIQDNNGKKTIAAEFGRSLYVGAEDNENIGQTLLLLRNRKTGKVRLIETGSVELKPIIDLNHDQEETQHQQQGNRIVKTVQYEETGTHTISNTSTPLISSISEHISNSTPSKKGSTTSFSRTHSGQFKHLHNFVVDEIRLIPNHQSETECNKSPKSTKVIETNQMEEFTVGTSAKQLNEANKMTASEELSRSIFEEKETDMLNALISSENSNYTIGVSTEELGEENKIVANDEPLEDFLDEKGTDLEVEEMDSTIDIKELSIFSSDSADTSSELEDENNLKSKTDQEKHEETLEIHKNYSIKQYYVAALGLDLKAEEKMKQNADLSTSNDNLTNTRTKNNSISSNHTENIYICDYCQAVFENKGFMIFHLISHKFQMDTSNDVKQSNFETDIGNDRNSNLNEFNDSESSKRNNKLDTSTDNRSVNNNEIVKENTSSNHTCICDFCEAVFKNKSALKSHVTSHDLVNNASNDVTHAPNNRVIRIDNELELTDFNETSNDLKDEKNKKRKKKTFTVDTAFDNTYICDYCEAMFENKDALIFHLISHALVKHIDNGTRSTIKRTRTIANNNNERNSECKKKLNECKDGDKTTKNCTDDTITKNVFAHNKTVTENISSDNTYICDYCELMFEEKVIFISHITSHEKHTYNSTPDQESKIIINVDNYDNKNACSIIKDTGNETVTLSKTKTMAIDGDNNENENAYSKNYGNKIDENRNPELNATENIYICDYCEAVFEDKESLVLHLISHKLIKDIDNITITKTKEKVTENENVNPSKNMKKDIISDSTVISNTFKDKTRKRNNQLREQTATENAYVCDYCNVQFEGKAPLILHITSHTFAKDTDNVIQTAITTIQVNKDENQWNENNNAGFKNYGTSKNRNPDINEKSNDLKDEKNKKRKKKTFTVDTAFDNTYICDYCEAMFENKGALIFHLISHALVKHTDNGTRSRIKRTRTIANNNNERNSECKKKSNECKDGDKTTKNCTDDTIMKNVFAHNKTVTETISSDNTYICDYCEAMFEDKVIFISHITSHEKHTYNSTPDQESKIIINVDNYDNKNACSIIKDTGNETVTLSKTKTMAIDGDNNENENAYSKNYGNKIDENRNPELNATENIYICDYCEAVFEDNESLVLHLISHKLIKDIDNITITKTEEKVTKNENLNPSKNMKKDIISDSTEISNTFKDKIRKRNNQLREQTATENAYVCDYCNAQFEGKAPLILHITSHTFAKDTDNVIQTKITTIQGNNAENQGSENNNACSKNYENSKKRNPDINEKSKEFKDGLNKKRKFKLRENIKLVKVDQGKQIENGETEIENDTVEDINDNDIATKLINCKHCTYKTDKTSTSNILKHIVTHTQADSNQCESIYICNDCGSEFKSKVSLIIHIESHKNNTYKNLRIRRHLCLTCNSSFTTQTNLINHQTKLHPSIKPYKCTICDNKYNTKQRLTEHIQTHKIKPFRCAICKYQCNKNNFVKHMKSHMDSKRFRCELCDAKFDYKGGLKQHMVTHSGKKEHKCTICDSTFALLNGLNRHLLIHSKYKPFKCETCSASFKDITSLKQHQKYHTGKKSYKCTHCEYSSITTYNLKRHLKIHDTKLKQKRNVKLSNSEIHQCTMCDSKFILKNSLICHMKIHTGEKLHKCTFCDKEFIRLSGLKRHLAVHSKNKPVICTTCNTSYDNETALKCHLRRSKKHQ